MAALSFQLLGPEYEDHIGFEWYKACVELSAHYEMGSFGYIFWWGARYELASPESVRKWARDPVQAMEDWFLYLEYKWDTLAHHRKSENG